MLSPLIGRWNRITRLLHKRLKALVRRQEQHDEVSQAILKEDKMEEKQDTEYEVEVTPWGFEVQVGHLRIKVGHIGMVTRGGMVSMRGQTISADPLVTYAQITVLDQLNLNSGSETMIWDSTQDWETILIETRLADITEDLVPVLRAIYRKWTETETFSAERRSASDILHAITRARNNENALREILRLRHDLQILKVRVGAFYSQDNPDDELRKAEWRWVDEMIELLDAAPLSRCSVEEMKGLAEKCQQMMPPEEGEGEVVFK